MKTPIRTLSVIAAAVLAISLTGCSTGAVEQEDVEEGISAEIENQVGAPPEDISCPDDLTAEEGETMDCTVTAGEEELNVVVTVDSVDGSDVSYSFEVEELQ